MGFHEKPQELRKRKAIASFFAILLDKLLSTSS